MKRRETLAVSSEKIGAALHLCRAAMKPTSLCRQAQKIRSGQQEDDDTDRHPKNVDGAHGMVDPGQCGFPQITPHPRQGHLHCRRQSQNDRLGI
jgi:hypothetical protein